MGIGKRANILSDAQVRAALAATESPTGRVMILLSVKAGLRACEIAAITWPMVLDAAGGIAESIALANIATKGRTGGREIPIHPELRAALEQLHGREGPIVTGRGGRRMTRKSVGIWFGRLYRSLGFLGASSHSGRRTFITRGARKIVEAGGSLRDIQQLAGHHSLSTTQGYIEGSTDAKRKVILMI